MDDCLKIGYKLSFPGQSEKYTIMEVIGRGASTIAYSARTESGTEYILKEYCPQNLHLERDLSGSLRCDNHDSERFERGKQEFLAAGKRQRETRNIIQLRNETPPFLGTYDANNTRYSIIVAFAGRTFDPCSSELSLLTKIKVCCAVAKLVSQYHQKGYLCLDIKPDNLFVLTNSSEEIVSEIIEYIDFDSVRKKSELSFGRSISFTKNWAAPEQTNPYGYNKICEATDIYAIGELIFVSVFGRHSFDGEHRDYSVYPFDAVSDPKTHKVLSRTLVQNILSELFHSTLRPSVKNRWQSMDKLCAQLKKLIAELERKEYIVESVIRPKGFFIGRTEELRQIDDALHEHNIVFVSGVAGIGKSELVKQYIRAHKKDYDNILYWTYDSNIDNMVARESTVRISGLSRISEENDFQYAKRILDKVNELSFNNNNLIVIDNLNQLVDELPQEGTWERIRNLHGKILITTRICENQYHSIAINALSNTSDLFQLFQEFCPFSHEELRSVHDIINLVDHHTLLVELLAHLTKATHTSPSQTLEKLRNNGISGLSNETVRLLKDGKVSSDSVHEHVKKIFSMESISDSHALILAMLAFMPVDGVETSKFASFFSIENYEYINWLINHGWVTSISGFNNSATDIIKIHSTVASVVVEYLKTKDHLLDAFFARNCDAIQTCESKQISESEQILFADSLALSAANRYPIKCRSAAIFIEQYVEQYSRYGNAELKLAQIEFAIRILEGSSGENKYRAVVENGYYLQASILYTLQQYDRIIPICEEHLTRAKQVKDIYFSARWCLLLQGIYSDAHLGNQAKWSKYNRLSISYIKKNLRRNSHFLSRENLLGKLDYDYLEKEKDRFPDHLEILNAELLESVLDINILFLKYSKLLVKLGIGQLSGAKMIREIVQKRGQLYNTDNNLRIELDKTKVLFLANQQQKAEESLQELISFINRKGLSSTPTIYYIHQLLAQIILWKEDCNHEVAISEFECCLKIGEDLRLHNTYMEQIELGYLYIACGELEKAEAVNTKLLHETYFLAPSIRKTYYADTLRNMGYLYCAKKNYSEARDMLDNAISEYKIAVAPNNFIIFGQARTYMHLAACMSDGTDPGGWLTRGYLAMAIDLFDRCVGPEYPEAKICLKQLEELKAQQQM